MQCVPIKVDVRIRSGCAIKVLSWLVSERGAPRYLRSDNGQSGVRLAALLKWIVDQGTETTLIAPGKAWPNDPSERFNGKFRDKWLSLKWP